MGPWCNGGRLRPGDRAALPLPACHKGVYARLRRAMERSEFARSSRKFRVRGPLHESELRGKAPLPFTSPPLWTGPLTPSLSPQAVGESQISRTILRCQKNLILKEAFLIRES